MKTNTNTISVNYSDERLRTLVEEFITMQKADFTFKDICSYVLYWAKEEGMTANIGFFESNELDANDCNRLKRFLEYIVRDGRITVVEIGDVPNEEMCNTELFIRRDS